MAMTKTRSRKALYIGLPLALAVALGSAAGYFYWQGREAGYPRQIVEQANALHEHMLSFDSHVTVPLDLGSAGNELTRTARPSSTWSRPTAGACRAPR
jgi:membrane dipeptidase